MKVRGFFHFGDVVPFLATAAPCPFRRMTIFNQAEAAAPLINLRGAHLAFAALHHEASLGICQAGFVTDCKAQHQSGTRLDRVRRRSTYSSLTWRSAWLFMKPHRLLGPVPNGFRATRQVF